MRKKICFIVPHLRAGGQERVVSEVANHFAAKNTLEVNIILFTKAPINYKIDKNIVVFEPDFHSDSQSKAIITIKVIFFIRHTIKNIKPDVIVSFGEVWNSLVLISCLFIKADKYVSDRCRPSLKLHIIHRFLRKLLYPTVKGIISQTELAKQVMFERTKHSNIAVIGNPIRKIEDKGLPRKNIILNVGRFVSGKRQALLIQMFSELRLDNWILMLVGDGHLLEKCKSLAQDLDIINKVIFPGAVSNIDDYYMMSKIFAFTSKSEGFPNVLGEAQSAGLAIITFDFEAGVRDLVENNINGFIIPEGDREGYKACMLRLSQDEQLRLSFSRNASKKIIEFESQLICEKYYDFLTGLNRNDN